MLLWWYVYSLFLLNHHLRHNWTIVSIINDWSQESTQGVWLLNRFMPVRWGHKERREVWRRAEEVVWDLKLVTNLNLVNALNLFSSVFFLFFFPNLSFLQSIIPSISYWIWINSFNQLWKLITKKETYQKRSTKTCHLSFIIIVIKYFTTCKLRHSRWKDYAVIRGKGNLRCSYGRPAPIQPTDLPQRRQEPAGGQYSPHITVTEGNKKLMGTFPKTSFLSRTSYSKH